MSDTLFAHILRELIQTVLDLVPILAVIVVFQLVLVRRALPNLGRILIGLAYVGIGLALFRIGVSESLIPVGQDIARQLVTTGYRDGQVDRLGYLSILAFATLIGFTATLIEPTLIATAERVEDLSGGAIQAWTLRLIIALGVAVGLLLGTLRILHELPLSYTLVSVVVVLIGLAAGAPRRIISIALDSGAVATSAVTVPLIAAFGLAVAEAMPNDATAADGFGLIVLALLMPAVLLLAFARIYTLLKQKRTGGKDAV